MHLLLLLTTLETKVFPKRWSHFTSSEAPTACRGSEFGVSEKSENASA